MTKEEAIKLYESMIVPKEYTKPIDAGKLKDFTMVNPQWRLEIMTKNFGLCGIGWKFEIVDTKIYECPAGQVLVFMTVAVRVKDGDQWSEPIFGCGGDFIIEKNKNGLVPNDESYKKCLTDAIGNALKCIGVANNIYKGEYDNKYNRRTSEDDLTNTKTPIAEEKNAYGANRGQKTPSVEYVKREKGITFVFVNNNWFALTNLSKEQLSYLASNKLYEKAHAEIKVLLQKYDTKTN